MRLLQAMKNPPFEPLLFVGSMASQQVRSPRTTPTGRRSRATGSVASAAALYFLKVGGFLRILAGVLAHPIVSGGSDRYQHEHAHMQALVRHNVKCCVLRFSINARRMGKRKCQD